MLTGDTYLEYVSNRYICSIVINIQIIDFRTYGLILNKFVLIWNNEMWIYTSTPPYAFMA
jgi:hypothetical protein